MKNIFANAIITLISILLFFGIFEGMSRVILHGSLSFQRNTVSEGKFYRHDPIVGWAYIPNIYGRFFSKAAGYNVHVTFDKNGIRNNANEFESDLKNSPAILIVGDSFTAGLEVGDNKTYAAQLEKLLFESNCKYRVYNAGVRGYGTDQSYWNLLRRSETLKPAVTIYMFTANDIADNRTIKRIRKKFSKPAYGLKDGSLELVKPEKDALKRSYYAYLKNSKTSGYEVVSGQSREFVIKLGFFIKDNFSAYEFLSPIYNRTFGKRVELESENSGNIDADIIVFRLLLDRMKSASSQFFLTEFGYPGDTPTLTDLLDFERDDSIRYIDVRSYFTPPYPQYHWDGDFHWNEHGHKTVATALFDGLREQICVN